MRLDPTSRELIALALREDFGPGDVTSAVIPEDVRGTATILAKSELVLAGAEAFAETYRQVDPTVTVVFSQPEGASLSSREVIGTVSGSARSILGAERVALNLLQHLSGIATAAARAQALCAGTKARVVDTRKTMPGLRALEKHAVRAGGAYNHRFGLFDGILIKDNHIGAAGGITAAVAAARASAHHLLKIECEVTTLDELDEALAAKVDVVLLDNMDTPTMIEAVRRTAGRALLEASGGITLARVPEIAKAGVDLISMGALTHTVVAADISLEWDR